jgi:ATP-binding cassette subfamily B protein
MDSLARYRRLLFTYLRPQRGQVFLLAVLVTAGIGLQLINPQLVRRFLDAVESNRSIEELMRTAALFTVIGILTQVLKVAGTYIGENVAWTATNELRLDLALHCLKLDMSFHKVYKPGELIERVDGDVNYLANFFSRLFIELTSNLLLIAGVLVLLWLIDWRVGLSITVIALAGMIFLNRVNRRIVALWQVVRQAESELFGYLEEWIGGTEEIQSSRAEVYILGRLYRLLKSRWRATQRAMRSNIMVSSLPIVLPGLALIFSYIWGYRLFGSSSLTIGSVYLIFYYLDLIRGPLWGIQRQVQELQRATAGINRIDDLFNESATIKDEGIEELPRGPLELACDDVSFRYEDDPETPILNDITFQLKPGRVLGLLGRTGSGKSTLSRLLLRLYEPSSGVIRLGDGENVQIDLSQVKQASLRQRIGMVTQEVELFHATVRDNLTLFDDEIHDDNILSALEHLGLSQWLESLPDGLDTPLEAGKSLSAGESQLLALGRVFLADAGLIILDEASSRLDPATEQLLERAITRLLDGRTAIIIAHRLATVRRADEIAILSDGEIVEYGDRIRLERDPSSRFSRLLKLGMEEAELSYLS